MAGQSELPRQRTREGTTAATVAAKSAATIARTARGRNATRDPDSPVGLRGLSAARFPEKICLPSAWLFRVLPHSYSLAVEKVLFSSVPTSFTRSFAT
jgi:hypothetical protein